MSGMLYDAGAERVENTAVIVVTNVTKRHQGGEEDGVTNAGWSRCRTHTLRTPVGRCKGAAEVETWEWDTEGSRSSSGSSRTAAGAVLAEPAEAAATSRSKGVELTSSMGTTELERARRVEVTTELEKAKTLEGATKWMRSGFAAGGIWKGVIPGPDAGGCCGGVGPS
jgi:hypothetical protein